MATNKSKNNNTKPNTKKSSTGSKKQSTPNYQKKAIKTVKKAAKKNPKVFLIIILVAILVIGIGVAVYFLFLKDKFGPKGDSSSEPTSSEPIVAKNAISINFLELGNKYTGDSTFIKAGDVDILIDAGSRNDSIDTIKAAINKQCTDGKLEYVIATHAHEDHIGAFFNESGREGIFYSYKIGTLIEFARTNLKTETDKGNITKYGKYVRERDARIASGDIEHKYTALQCVEETDGAKKEYTIADGITMTILDQKFYHESSGDENNYSVCALFKQGSNNYLFTGDLEEDGEISLVEKNTLPHCQLFKGGHHGSPTSNNDCLLNAITPENVCICCCAGHDEYTKDPRTQFPSRDAITRISKHTENIYVTTVSPDGHETHESMNGTITFSCADGTTYTIIGSNNNLKLKETEWYATRIELWKKADEDDAKS